MATFYIKEKGLWLPLPGQSARKADLYVGTAVGEPRLRCSGCGKVAYATKELATRHAVEISKKTPRRPYFDRRCGWYHLTKRGAEEWLQEYREGLVPDPVRLRDYQEASVAHLFSYFETHPTGNPIIALPTGTGKSLIIADFVKRACLTYPGTQVLMLTHVKELIVQNFDKLIETWPTAPAGIYSAGLGRREHHDDITFAGIQSVFRKPQIFGRVDLVIIDECHLVSPKAETMYGKFIDALREVNPYIRVIGLSATPYRMKHGMLTDPGGLFTDVIFDLTDRTGFNWLIGQGYLAPVVPKRAEHLMDVSGVKLAGGEFVLKELQERFDRETVTMAALHEAVPLAHRRKHWLIFASGIEHAEHIAEYLNESFGIPAAAVHSKLSDQDRDQRIRDFKSGKLRAVVNNNVLTTGFDFPDIDCIIMLRPTMSPGLWVQMVGRGTRPAPEKVNCLCLDFAGNTERLGPINDPVLPKRRGRGAPGPAPVRLCEQCGCYSHASARFCENPECGAEFPRNVNIFTQASLQDLIAGTIPEVHTIPIDKVTYRIHQKEGRPDSMRVDYYAGIRRFSEWVKLDHGGYSTRLAKRWWEQRCPWGVPPSTHEGMKAVDYLKVPKAIQVVERGRYPEICGYTFSDGTSA